MKNLKIFYALLIMATTGSCYLTTTAEKIVNQNETEPRKVSKSLAQWKNRLTPLQYEITCLQGTEAPYSGMYWNNKQPGNYKCIRCENQLFISEAKFESGTGWPSFFDVARSTSVIEKVDTTQGMHRVEVLCAKCDGHLGHLFLDGPNPTGKRYCMNSAALNFIRK